MCQLQKYGYIVKSEALRVESDKIMWKCDLHAISTRN